MTTISPKLTIKFCVFSESNNQLCPRENVKMMMISRFWNVCADTGKEAAWRNSWIIIFCVRSVSVIIMQMSKFKYFWETLVFPTTLKCGHTYCMWCIIDANEQVQCAPFITPKCPVDYCPFPLELQSCFNCLDCPTNIHCKPNEQLMKMVQSCNYIKSIQKYLFLSDACRKPPISKWIHEPPRQTCRAPVRSRVDIYLFRFLFWSKKIFKVVFQVL